MLRVFCKHVYMYIHWIYMYSVCGAIVEYSM